MVQRIAKVAGVKTSPHKIRHRACTDIVQTGAKQSLPEEDLLFLTGHSSRAALAPYYEASKSRKSARAVLDALPEVDEEL
jgi:integrase